MKVLMSFLLLIFMLQSCSITPSYDVRVVNTSGEPIVVRFNSQYSLPGFQEQKVELGQDESAVIITTPDIDNETPNICHVVAKSITAERVSDGTTSTLTWCSDAIKIELVDIGQYQFLVNYTASSFLN